MLVSSSQSLCSKNWSCLPSLFVKIRCLHPTLVADRPHSSSTLVTKRLLQLQSTMATPYRRVLCATKSVVRPYPHCCRTTCPMYTRQKLKQDTCSSASSRQLRDRNILMFKVWRNLMLIPHTIVGASNRLLMISKHNSSTFQRNL
jgi:hypothetical protein